ncbi:MAG TPA: hypothetical protein DCG57_17760 [Candidatus Riflebacteria bacterium]|nr:hypothetical protein [Candidatus Riflebacteria bacterium]
MKKIFAVLLAVAVFAPASAMAQYKPNQKPNKPAYNGPVTHPGSNHGGIHSQPGTSVPNHGNNGGYNNGSNNNGNNGGYNNGNNGHSNNGGYNNGNNGHGNNGGYNPGHGHGYPGNHGPAVKYELMNAHRTIERAFRTVENSYFPIFMSHEDKRKMGRAIGMLSGELNNIMRLVDRRYRDEIRDIAIIVDRAKFDMFSENDVRGAFRKIQMAESRYNRLANSFYRR